MKRIVLHVGQPKTGSSALQLAFVKNRKALEEKGVGYFRPVHQYCRWRVLKNATFLVCAAQNGGPAPESLLSKLTEEDLKALSAYAGRLQTQILSDEMLWLDAVKDKGYWQVVREILLSNIGTDTVIDIAVCLRRQDQWIVSWWKECMRGRDDGAEDFASFLARCRKEGHLDYQSRLKELSDCFGREHIIVQSYDDVAGNKGRILRRFLDDTGIKQVQGIKENERIRYPSFSLNMAEAIRLIKTGAVRYPGSFDDLISAAWKMYELLDSEKKEHPLAPEERRSLLNEYEKGNRWIAQEFMSKDQLFSEEIEEYELWKEDPVRDMTNARALVAFARQYLEAERNDP